VTDQTTPVQNESTDSAPDTIPETAPAVEEVPTLAPDAPEHRRRNTVVIALLLVSTFVVFLNETVMNVALPPIMKDLGVLPSVGQWLTTAFLLTMAVVIPTTGFLLQRFNTRTVYLAAMVLFSAGTLLAALAPNFGVLVAGRVVQASGTAIMMPLLMTTVLTLVAPKDRGRIMGRVSIVMSVAPAIGPTVSGLILSATDNNWRFLFWLVLPLAVGAIALGFFRMQNVTEPRVVPVDVLSVILSAFAFGGLIYGLSSLGEMARGTVLLPPWIPLVVGGLAMVGFVLRQFVKQRTDSALLDLRVFQARDFTIAVLLLCTSMLALFGTIILLPIYVQDVLNLEPIVIGLLLLPGGLLMGLLGPTVGRLVDRFGPKVLVVPGTIIISAVFWGMTLLNENSSYWWVFAAYTTLCLGLALLFTPLFSTGLGALKPHLYSHGSAIVATLQQVAGAAGTALFIALMVLQSTALEAGGVAEVPALAGGIHIAFIFGAALSMFAILLAFFVRKPAVQEHAGAGDWGH
jgi:MFS transporter, DHA2 family, lincomycin resistance protein